jgi:hypothetical protein
LRDDDSPDVEKGIVIFIKRLYITLSEFCPDICPWADIAVALPVFTCTVLPKNPSAIFYLHSQCLSSLTL